jgi:two-component system CheB/CheR fusion protein
MELMREKTFTQERTPNTNIVNRLPVVAITIRLTNEFIQLLEALPADTGMAFVTLGPNDAAGKPAGEPADAVSTFQPFSAMPVVIPGPDTVIEPNHVYLLPPGISAQLVKGQLAFRPNLFPSGEEKVADLFLATIAAAAPGRHIAVLGSTMTEDSGTALRVIRAEGGYSIQLTEDDPFFFPNPHLQVADFVLTIGDTPAKLRTLKRAFTAEELRPDGQEQAADLHRIYLQLLQEKGVDFSGYRQVDMLHRIHRRMVVTGIATLSAYCSVLQDEYEELSRLYEELQCSMRDFFLEPVVEHALTTEVLPRVLSGRRDGSPLRIWMPGCTGGQQAYSLAIFLLDYLEKQGITLPVQLFATDLNKAAIDRARIGIYDPGELTQISSRRKKKYFVKRPDGMHVSNAIREMCVFATHNLLKDPPFSRVDIIISTSMLAGLKGETLDNIFRALHYALTPSGYLLPGRMRSRDYPADRWQLVSDDPYVFIRKETAASVGSGPAIRAGSGEQEADRMLLSGYVPAAVLIDEQLRVIRYYGNIEPYLRRSEDRLSLHLLRIIRDELVFELDDLIERSEREDKPIKVDGVVLSLDQPGRKLSIEVAPLHSFARKWRLILIREMPEMPPPAKVERPVGRMPTSKDLRILALEKELTEMRGLLLAADEESSEMQLTLQRFNEEIMASNEELQSINEQLQSTNDELRSDNVELNTVNKDLYGRNRELEVTMDYAHAIVGSLRQPLVVLQNDIIRTANPAFCSFFGLKEEEMRGKRIWVTGHGLLDREELRQALRHVVAGKEGTAELELRIDVPGRGERVLALNITRLQKVRDIRLGLLLAIEDVTERKRMERFKDEFIGIASHELKTPVTTIQAYSQLLYQELAETRDPQPIELVKKLNGQVNRLTRLTKDLLDVTRISQGQINLKGEAFDMGKLIVESVEELQVTTEIRLVFIEEGPLRPVKGDKERIGQVLVNLLTNAIKYAPDSKEIIIRAKAVTGKIIVSVQDFGVGMTPESSSRIFDRYYRSEEAFTGRHPGVGLGLYISLEIIRRHGGNISVSTAKDKGSIFMIELPVD